MWRFAFPALNRDIVTTVAGFAPRVCPLECRPGERVVDERCVPASQPVTSSTPGAAAPNRAVLCSQINERAQLGVLTDQDRELLRTLQCR